MNTCNFTVLLSLWLIRAAISALGSSVLAAVSRQLCLTVLVARIVSLPNGQLQPDVSFSQCLMKLS
jgi:hypothetical protein